MWTECMTTVVAIAVVVVSEIDYIEWYVNFMILHVLFLYFMRLGCWLLGCFGPLFYFATCM